MDLRTDIFSYRDDNHEFLVEIHSSKKKRAKHGGEFEAKSKEKISKIIGSLSDDQEIHRVVVDKDWKKVQIITKDGVKQVHSISKLLHPEKKPTATIQPTQLQATLLASTDKSAGKQYVKGGFIQRGFTPVTPMETLWKFFNNVSQFITGLASKQNKSLGSYGFATHFFSKEATRKELQKEEAKSSTLLRGLADYCKDNGLPAENIAQAAGWAEKIENLRDKHRITIINEFEAIAQELHKAKEALKPGESMLIPFSTYQGQMGEKVGSFRLVELTREDDTHFTLKFIDANESPPVTKIDTNLLTVEDFFKPLVDIQLSASFTEEPTGILQKIMEGITRFAINHPKITAWALMGKSPKEERAAVANFLEHSKALGLLNATTPSAEKSQLTPQDLLRHVFAPIIAKGDREFGAHLFEPKPQLLSAARTIDNFLPLLAKQDQAKLEATSLFQFYYLYEACLADDPATMAVLESGLNRICELYERLNILEPETTEMLRVIRTHIDRAKLQVQKRTLNLSEKVVKPTFSESYALRMPGKEYGVGLGANAQLAAEPAISTVQKMPYSHEAAKQAASQETKYQEQLSALDALSQAIETAQKHQELIQQMPIAAQQEVEYLIRQTEQNLDVLIENLKTVPFGDQIVKSLGDSIQRLRQKLRNPDLTSKDAESLAKEYEQLFKALGTTLGSIQMQKQQECLAELQKNKEIPQLIAQQLAQARQDRESAKQELITRLREGGYNAEADRVAAGASLLLLDWSIRNRYYYQINRYESSADPISQLERLQDSYPPKNIAEMLPLLENGLINKTGIITRYNLLFRDMTTFMSSIHECKLIVRDLEEKLFRGMRGHLASTLKDTGEKIAGELELLKNKNLITNDQYTKYKAILASLETTYKSIKNESSYQAHNSRLNELTKLLPPLLQELNEAKESKLKEVVNPDLTTLINETVNPRVAACKERYKEPLTDSMKTLLRQEIDEILLLMPMETLQYAHCPLHARYEFEGTFVALRDLVKLAADDTTIGDNTLRMAMVSALLQAVRGTDDEKLVNANYALLPQKEKNKILGEIKRDREEFRASLTALKDPYLRFNTATKQLQLLSVLHYIESIKNTRNVTITKATNRSEPPHRGGLEFSPVRLTPNKAFVATSYPFKSDRRNGSNTSSCYEEIPSNERILLEEYVEKDLDGTSETAIRLDTNRTILGSLPADEAYKILSTNCDDPLIGIEQLILQLTSPKMKVFLNDTTDALHINLRNLIENRLLRPGHLEAFLKDPNHAASTLAALNGAIESALLNHPHTYITLTTVKATLLTFLTHMHRFDDKLYADYTTQMANLVQGIAERIGSSDKEYEEVKHDLHLARLKIAAVHFASDRALVMNGQWLQDSVDSWLALKHSQLNPQEKLLVNSFFYAHILPAWNSATKVEQQKILTHVMQQRGKIGKDETLSWQPVGTVYTTTLPDKSACQIGLCAGTIAVKGAPVTISKDPLPAEIWEQFPLKGENFKPIDPQRIEVKERGKLVYEFGVEGLSGARFQVEYKDGRAIFSIKKPDSSGTDSWFEYCPMKRAKDVLLEQKEKKEAKETEKEKKNGEPETIGQVIKAVVRMITQPIRDLQEDATKAGQALGKQMLRPDEEQTVPRDVVEQGLWIQKGNATRALVLNNHAETLYHVGLSQGFFSIGDEEKFTPCQVSSVTAPKVGENEPLTLVNSTKSTLYNQLAHLTRKEEIQIWADASGTVQKVVLTDPKMLFERDPSTGQLMSQELNGFYIAEDQSLPIANFAKEWNNYLILTNDKQEKRLIMRPSAILSENVLKEHGYERVMALQLEKERIESSKGFIDVELIEHPEKGYILQSPKAQSNLYLGLAAVQCLDFKEAMRYIRAAARSSPYEGVEQELLKQLFAYKNDSFSEVAIHAEKPFEKLSALAAAMQKYEPMLPSIAAAKLAALACLLDQDLTKNPKLKELLPSGAQIASWLTIYNLPAVPGSPFYAMQESSRLTDAELYKIFLRYPGGGQGVGAQALKRGVELTKAPQETLQVEEPVKPEMMLHTSVSASSEFAETLAATRQTTSTEQTMTFTAGSYIIRHFKELYEKIDLIDATTTEGKKELEALITKFDRYKDNEPSRKSAIRFLKQIALQKYHRSLGQCQIQLEAARLGLKDHLEKLKEHRDKVAESYEGFLAVLNNKTDDLIPQADLDQLKAWVVELNNLEFTDVDTSKLLLVEMQTVNQKKQRALHNLTSKIAVKLRALASQQRVTVRGDLEKIQDVKSYRTYHEQRLTARQQEEYKTWQEERTLPSAAFLKKIKISNSSSLQDHLDAPGKYPIPNEMTVEQVLRGLDIDEDGIITPRFERAEWTGQELYALNYNLRALEEEATWTKKVYSPIAFPTLSRDDYNVERMKAFLESHTGLEEYAVKREEKAADEEKAENEPEVRSIPLAPAQNSKEAFANYEKALNAIESAEQEQVGHYNKANLAFFGNLTDQQLFALERELYTVSPTAQGAFMKLIEEPLFSSRPNAYELARQFLAQINIPEPADIAAECQVLRDRINLKEVQSAQITSQDTKRLVTLSAKVIDSNTPIADATSLDAIKTYKNSVDATAKNLAEDVAAKRKAILELANKLPQDRVAKNAEELARLRGAAITIDAETVFRLFAKEALDELKKSNPSLTDADILKIRDLVCEHHIQATALQTCSRQQENINGALALYDKIKTQQGLNQAITEFLQNKNDKPAKALIEDLRAHNPTLADNIRDFMAHLESCNKNAAQERHYDPRYNHPHTRAALAYEYTLGVVFRKDQIDEFTKRVGTPNIVSWLGTGFGKTFMAPGLAKMIATGTNLVCVVDTKDLIPTTSKTRDQDSRAVYGQAAYNFQFERNPDRSVEELQEIEYRLLGCIANEEYIVTSKEALGSLVLQLLTWQRLSVESGKYDEQIAVCQRIIALFKERGVALGDEIHLILNVIEALDYAEGDRVALTEYSQFYETISTIYRSLPKALKIAENRQAQVNSATVRDAMVELATTLIENSLNPQYQPKDPLHKVIAELVKKGVTKEVLIQFLTISENTELAVECPKEILQLKDDEKKRIATLKENLSNTFEKVVKKIADDDFGVSSDNLSICPYSKGRPQPTKEFDDIFQTIQTHYIWYTINGIPVEGLKQQIAQWNKLIESELPEYEQVELCPSYVMYKEIFGDSAPSIRQLDAKAIEALAKGAKQKPEVLRKFLERVVFPSKHIYPKKLGFNSMDLVAMFNKFGGYSGTIQTRPSFSSGVANKDDPDVDARAAENFRSIYENPKNQDQHKLKDLDAPEMQAAAKAANATCCPLSQQLKMANIDIKQFRAIIDAGGLFKELDYRDMARDILNQFSPDELQAVLIYNDKSELMILRRGSDTLEPFEPKTVPPDPELRFTVYRQPQITGADIPQTQHAKALVSINEKTSWGDFEQGVGRLRKNKEGQTYAVIYRESLMKKLDDDLAIAKKKGLPQAEIKRLEELKKGNKIDVKGLTQHAEQEEIKQRRYFAAINELETIVKQPIRELLCGPEWKEVFKIFQDSLFEESLKSPDQLLATKRPTPPLDILEKYRENLRVKVTKALELPQLQGCEALQNALKELEGYKLPKADELPEKVVGTAGDSTKETEVARETERAVESERSIESERIRIEESLQSNERSVPQSGWQSWKPTALLGLFSNKDINAIYSFQKNAPTFLRHIMGQYSRKALDVRYDTLFPNISLTQNMLQDRYRGLSLYSTGQKICRSVAEISLVQGGKRIYHTLLLDVRDHKQFEDAILALNSILTPAFYEAIKALPQDKSLYSLQSNPDFKKLFNSEESMKFFIETVGDSFKPKDLEGLAFRINTDGHYTSSCGALDITHTDEGSKEQLVRAKLVRGETFFTYEERKILKRLLSEEYLKVANFDQIRDSLERAGKKEEEIAAIIEAKQKQGIRDYKVLTDIERKKLEQELTEVYKLYSFAARSNQAHEQLNPEKTRFGQIAGEIVHDLRKRKP